MKKFGETPDLQLKITDDIIQTARTLSISVIILKF